MGAGNETYKASPWTATASGIATSDEIVSHNACPAEGRPFACTFVIGNDDLNKDSGWRGI